MKKFKQIFAWLLVIITTSIHAQTLPLPTLLDVKTFTFKGAGALPTINYTVPSGNDRAIAVLVNVDRYHSPSGSNHFLVNYDYNSLLINGSELFSSGGFYQTYPASLASVPISAFSRGFWYTEQYTSIPDNVTITFPSTYYNAAKSAQDDMVVIVASFENVGQIPYSTADTFTTAQMQTSTSLSSSYSIPKQNGRNYEETLFGMYGYSTKQGGVTLSGTGWVTDASAVSTNSGTVISYGGVNNENDGVSSFLGHIYGDPAGLARSYTMTRASGNTIMFMNNLGYPLYPLASPTITGNVYLDTDGATNINGVGTNAGGLYVNVIDSNNKLVYSAVVDATGNFTVPNRYVLERRTYNLQLSKNTGTIGSTAPIKELPGGWSIVGESKNTTGNDNSVDGVISSTVYATDITGLRYGIVTNPCGSVDSDGDDIADICDLDSDNDGILDTVECPPTELVNNGTFTGNANGWTLGTGWAYTNNYIENQNNSISNSALSQTLNNLDKVKAGVVALNLRIGAQDGGQQPTSTASLNIKLNGVTYATLNNGTLRDNSNITIAMANGATSNFVTYGTNGVSGFNWRNFTIYIPYTGPATATLSFEMTSATDDWSIDDVSVQTMICDKDGDGIPNYLDLDSDGEGCSDAIEGGANFTNVDLHTALGTIASQTLNQNLGNTVDANGVPIIAGATGQLKGQSQDPSKNDCFDTDGDDVPDWQDLDDDNDGILDTDECTSSNLINNGTFTGNANGWEMHEFWNHDSTNNRMYIDANNVNRTLWQTLNPLNLFQNNIIPVTFTLGAQDEGNAAGEKATLQIKLNGVVYATITNGTDRSNSNITINMENGATTNFVSFGSAGINDYATQTFTIWIPYSGLATGDLSFVTVSNASNFSRDNWSIDNVSIIGILCDTDNDGIPNLLDLDSDGDGCPDAIEGGANFVNADLHTATGTIGSQTPNQNLGNTVDGNGVPIIAGATGQGIGNAQNAMLNDCFSFICPPDPYAAQQTWWLPYRWASSAGLPNSAVRIDFQTGSAILNNPVTGTFGHGSTSSFEGNVSVTNPISGELIFVTDGNNVYRGVDGLLANGPRVGGNESAGEAAAVIPDPNGILGRNFIIFGNSSGNTVGSLTMAKYDVQTNTVSSVTTLLANVINEALEVIPHTNGTDYWILVHTNDQNVKSYLYSKTSGFNTAPSSVTSVPDLAGIDPSNIAINTFISWDPRNSSSVLITRQNKIGIASFNPSTGVLGTWNVKVTTNTGVPNTDSNTGYSAALSANGKYIYYVAGGSNIVRYHDIDNGTNYSIGTVGAMGAGLKIAKDGRLYVVGYPPNSEAGLYYFNTPDTPSTTNITTPLPIFDTGGRGVSLQLPNNVYWGCLTCQSGTSAPALASTTSTTNPATVADLIALLSASNQPAGTVITIHSATPATDANKLANTTAIVLGSTYYASFYDGLAICYSPTTAVTVGLPYCFKPAVLDAGNIFPTKHGITAIGRAGAENENWPITRQSAWTVLESKEKGFVVNRVATTANLTNITNPVEGMMVYDEQADCLKIFTLKSGDTVMAWHCFITPACPD